ncbi:MAG: Dam family site-specific DNA-(adenine-N6)-methyltransferase [Firmicutes bacterium]|nr:Dam family site-specific DNA-(adenine-N6)-methyltransferase [Bacillota bacterium]
MTISPVQSGILRPPLKWAGGKRWLVPYLKTLWALHSGRRLVEPLCGSLAITLGLMPDEALLNDINIHLINFFRSISKGLQLQLSMENNEDFYYSYRDRFNRLIREGREETAEAAELFYYLNRTGYNGLCRFNKKGEFNVPFGSYKKINYIQDFKHYRHQFLQWKFESVDFELLSLKPADFIYADPPYDVNFTHYSKEGFVWDDQVRLANWLACHPGPVVLSNQATERIIELYSGLGFELKFMNAPRLISCNGNRTPAKEVLATKNI